MRIIERVRLQQLLLEAVRERGGTLNCDHRFKSAQKNGNGTLEVHFSNGSTETVDLLVGADGGWSSVRKYILREKYGDEKKVEERQVPGFMGASGFYGISRCGKKE
jgi:FAD-dependent urate hydroxylase